MQQPQLPAQESINKRWMNSKSSKSESTFLPFAPIRHQFMNLNCVGFVVCVCSLHWIYDSMKRTLLMAEVGQENACGKCGPGQMDQQWFCCKLELKDEARRPQTSSEQESLGSWRLGWCEGWGWQQRARSLLPITAVPQQSGQDRASGLTTPHAGFHVLSGSRHFQVLACSLQGKQLELTCTCPPQCHSQKPGPHGAARHPKAVPLTGDSERWVSGRGAPRPAGESQHHTLGTPGLDELRRRRVSAFGPKGFRQESQSFIYFHEVWNGRFKKKKSKLFYKCMNHQSGSSFLVAQALHVNDDEQPLSKVVLT